MMIRAILACDDDWGIGKADTLPWPHNAADLKWFKICTGNDVVVMGRKTWESLPIKPLPNRKNIVVSDSNIKLPEGVERVPTDIVNSRLVTANMEENIWIIGGATLLTSCLSIVDELWLSRISGTYDCDVFLPRDLIETTFNLVSSEREGSIYVDKWRAY